MIINVLGVEGPGEDRNLNKSFSKNARAIINRIIVEIV
jgi:hypothetical protein